MRRERTEERGRKEKGENNGSKKDNRKIEDIG